MTETPDRRWAKWSWAIGILLPIICAVTAFLGVNLHHKRFNSEIWKHSGEPYAINAQRLEMVFDLVKSKILEGKTKKEIIEALGDSDGDPAIQKRFPDWHLYYYLGPTKELIGGFDYDYLLLRFDARDKLIAIKIVTLHT